MSAYDEQLHERLEVIKPLLHLQPIPWSALTKQAQKAGRSPRTLQRWIKLYREQGPDGLRAGKPNQRQSRHHDWEPFILQHFLKKNRPSMAKVYGQCRQEAERQGLEAPSYSTVRRIILKIPQSVQAYHRQPKEFKDKYQVTGELYQAAYPGELYLIDHRKLDLLIFLKQDKAARPWITAVLDQYSRAVAGYYLGFEGPSSRRVALALRHAILPKNDPDWPMCGLPSKVRHDHGQDLVSKHIKQVRIDLGIGHLPKEKGNPKGNAEMERFYGTMADWERSLPGWVGSSIRERPDQVSPRLDLAELDKAFQAFVRDYHRRKHSTTKMTPFDRWHTGLIPNLPESEAALDLLLLPVSRGHKIRRDGIHFQTNRYWCDELLPYIGETAALRYDPLRLDEIVVYIGNNRLGTGVIVAGQRLTFGSYKKRRAQQRELMRQYGRQKDELEQPNHGRPVVKGNTQKETELQSLVLNYQEEMENKFEASQEPPIKVLWPVEEGADWC